MILTEHYDTIFAFSMRALGSRVEAEDLTQDVCLSLAERLPEFRGEAKLSTWLYRIVANAARDRMRKAARHAALGACWGEQQILEEAQGRERTEGRRFLQDAMAHLDPTDRVLTALVCDGGFSQAEVAEIMDMAPGTVAWRMSEIKSRLSEMAQAATDGRKGAVA